MPPQPPCRCPIVERFFRAHAKTVTGVEGTGLGLSIVRETVEDLGGRAWAEPREQGGSVFAFALPATRKEELRAAGATPKPPLREGFDEAPTTSADRGI